MSFVVQKTQSICTNLTSVCTAFLPQATPQLHPNPKFSKMPTQLLKHRILFFAALMAFQVFLQVTTGLCMYAMYSTARYLLLKAFDLLPNQTAANLWQVGLLFLVLG